MRLTVSANTRPLTERLLEGALRADDIAPIGDQLLDVIRSASARQFATGAGWVRSHKAGATLVDTGRLRDSFTRAGGASSTSTRGESVTLETRVPYAGYLADGARGMPARDPSRVDDWRVARDAAQVLVDYITGEL